ncbi:NAD(+) synthase [Beduini massiliensis]|uniref:NAD(+) synthase n=1 Tax=Beduini massiliensis TaxID=1585974 RepID=UPI00059A8ED8|nr:NAD(+) synthase [Beduini massiliensis]
MKDGFIRVGAASIHTKIADCISNTEQIIAMMRTAQKNQTKILVFPELAITGYTCEDLFFQDRLLNEALLQLKNIITASKSLDMVTIVGLPYVFNHKLYNVAAVIYEGQLLGLVPKTHIPNYSEFYEARHFESGQEILTEVLFEDQIVPFGSHLLFENAQMPAMSIGVEICEDLWAPNPPSSAHALAGATIIANASASNELTGKSDYRRLLVQSQSARLVTAYIYANAGVGESTTDVVFSGHNLIGENGAILNESDCYFVGITYADIDVSKLASERRKMTTFKTHDEYDRVYFNMPIKEFKINRYYDPTPFVPSNPQLRQKRCEEVFNIQIMGLKQRLEATHTKKAVIGISGGLDSTLALLVTHMTFQKLGLPSENIYAITMPCFGTTSRTLNNALGLMEELGVTSKTIPIKEAVLLHFDDIGHDENLHDVTYENVQARERTQVLMDLSNQIGGIVVGTGDLSEVALGWSTYNGDHMSMYGVNASVPKTLVRYLVDYVAGQYKGQRLETLLRDVLDTPVSPELLPAEDNQITQKTEDIVGPYELHDFFLYHVVRFGYEPSKVLRIAEIAFHHQYDKEIILKWLKTFYRRFITQQFKRSCIPDGPKVGSVALSPRGDLRMPSDASYRLWLEQLDHL